MEEKNMFLESYFKKGKNATVMQKKERKKMICAMYGEDGVN